MSSLSLFAFPLHSDVGTNTKVIFTAPCHSGHNQRMPFTARGVGFRQRLYLSHYATGVFFGTALLIEHHRIQAGMVCIVQCVVFNVGEYQFQSSQALFPGLIDVALSVGSPIGTPAMPVFVIM